MAMLAPWDDPELPNPNPVGALSTRPVGALDPRTMALLGAAQGFFQAGAPSRMPTGFGGAMASGMQGALGGFQQAQQMESAGIKNEYMRAQMDALKKKGLLDAERFKALQGLSSYFQQPQQPQQPQQAPVSSIEQTPGGPVTTNPVSMPQGPQQIPMGQEMPRGAPQPPMTIPPHVLAGAAASGVDIKPFIEIMKEQRPDLEFRDVGGEVLVIDKKSMRTMGRLPKSAPPGARPYEAGDIPPDKYRDFLLNKSRAGATQLSIDQRADSAYGQRGGAQQYDRDQQHHDAAVASVENIQKLAGVLDHLKTSDAITGLGSDVRLQLERARALFAQSQAAGKRVSDTELLDSMLGSDVFSMIQALGVGARGMDTPAEREFMRNVLTGTTNLNKDTLIRMTEIRKNIAERAIQRWNDRVDRGELDRYFQVAGTGRQKIEMPKIDAPKTETPSTEFPRPSPAAINRLKMSPKEKDQFEKVFGPGSAARYLNGK